MLPSATSNSVPSAMEAHSKLYICLQAGPEAVFSIKCAKEKDGQQVASLLHLAGTTKKDKVGCCSRSMFAVLPMVQQHPGSVFTTEGAE